MLNSIWKKDVKNNNNYANKNGEIKTDVLIIGAGLSGISTAFYLKDSPLKVTLIESNKIISGTSLYTTGKITPLQGTIYSDLCKMYNYNVSKKYLDSQIYACNLIKENIKKYNIDCNYEVNDSYIFTRNNKNKKKIQSEYKFLKKEGIDVYLVKNIPIKLKCICALKIKNTAVFNPVKYLNYLLNLIKNKIKIYENTRALNIKKEHGYYIVETNKMSIKAKYVLVYTQYPFFILPSLIPLKTHIEKSHVVASKIEKVENFNAISIDKNTYSIRYYNDKEKYIIFAGESYKTSDFINYEERQKMLESKFKEIFNLNIDYRWSTHDIVSNDLLPFIGKINDNLLVATAFNKWGMTNGVLAGKILSDIVLRKYNRYIDLFKMKRPITIKRSMNFLIDIFNTSKIFLSTKIFKNRKFYKKNIKFERKKARSYGIYIDEKNKKHIVVNKCPHMKCSLVFNNMDKTWDCPCHGSRYDIDGNVIKGPSTKCINKL